MKMIRLLTVYLWTVSTAAFCLYGCATAPPAPRAHPATVDAVLPSGRNLFLFDFTQSRYRKWTLAEGPTDTLGLCRILDTLKGDWAAPTRWLALPAPSQPFAPMRAFWGPSGNFFILDRAGKRLLQYDSSAQFLSAFPLPREIRDRGLDRYEVFWTRDGVFSFLDLGEGTVRQYMEYTAPGGRGDWRLRNTIRLPVGLEACVWEPFFRNPCCIGGEVKSREGGTGEGVCFDAYFNPLGHWPEVRSVAGLRPVPDGNAGWRLILDGGAACAPSIPPACFSPDKGVLSTCPAETDPAPAQ